MRDDGRRARIMAAVTAADATTDAGALMQRLCRLAVDEMDLSGCAVVLMSQAESASVVAGSGRHAQERCPGCRWSWVRDRAWMLMPGGSRCCCRTCRRRARIAGRPSRRRPWQVGVHAEFSLPLTVGPGGIGTLDLCRDRPGMLTDDHLADALVAADIARDAALYQQNAPGRAGPGGARWRRRTRTGS